MTREEAIAVLEKEASIIDDNSIEMTAREWDEFDDLKRDAIPVAIEALSQPIVCKDCRIDDDHIYCSTKTADRVVEALSGRPHGKWVFSTSIPIGGGRESAGYKCSACGGNFFRVDGMNFCPNCGAVMTRHADPWRSESEKEYVENTIREASSGKD